jgi:glyoxylase-like metal-dependent hydrolase (beta-lactamase superfamily II)
VQAERFESSLWQTSSLLLVAGDEAVAVDPCITREEVARISTRSDELGATVVAVLATHADWDHVCGIAAFPEAEAAMSEPTAARIDSGDPWRRIEESAVQYGIEVVGAPRVDRRLETGVVHAVGPFTVETLALRGHTEDGTAFRVRSLDLLAVGDHLSTAEFPFASSTAEYRCTLAALIQILRRDPPARVVPGHGPELTATEALALAEADLDYLWRLRDAVAAVLDRAGSPADAREAGLAVATPRPAWDDLAEEHAANVEAQLAELLPS